MRFFHFLFFFFASLSYAGSTVLEPGGTFYTDYPPKGSTVSNVNNSPATASGTGVQQTQKVEVWVKPRPASSPPPHSNAWPGGTAKPVKTSFGSSLGWNKSTARAAIKTALKGGKRSLSPYLLIGSYALDYILNNTDWFVENDELVYTPPPSGENGLYPIHCLHSGCYDTLADAFDTIYTCRVHKRCTVNSNGSDEQYSVIGTINSPDAANNGGWGYRRLRCPYSYAAGVCIIDGDLPDPLPVTDAMIDALDLTGYTPHQSDVPAISPHLGKPDTVTITEQPKPIKMPTEITTTQNPDGTTSTTATDTTINVTINNNNGNLSVTSTTTTTTTNYTDGVQTSTKTETTTTDHSDSSPEAGENNAPQEMPTDCDLVPTLCETQKKIIAQDKDFYDWVRDGEDNPIPDLLVPDEQIPLNFTPLDTFSGTGTCPEDRQIAFDFMGLSVDFAYSYEPACRYATAMRPIIVLVGMFLAAMMVVAAIREL